jgi:hypothetical protein
VLFLFLVGAELVSALLLLLLLFLLFLMKPPALLGDAVSSVAVFVAFSVSSVAPSALSLRS